MSPEELAAMRAVPEKLIVVGDELSIAIACIVNAAINHIDSQASEIERLQKAISEPVASFGTPELIEWANELQKIIADFPESERGDLPFVMRMGCHLEKFAKSWHCHTLEKQAARIQELEAVLKEADQYRRASLDRVMKIANQRDNLEILNDALMENGNDLRARAQKAEARIQELEGDLEQCGQRLLLPELQCRRLEKDLKAVEERIREHEAHEIQTHAVLGKILGTDDTLENVAKRAVNRIAELEAQVAALKEIATNERERYHMLDMGRFGFVFDSEASPDPRKLAERWLSEEHPEAFREEAKR